MKRNQSGSTILIVVLVLSVLAITATSSMKMAVASKNQSVSMQTDRILKTESEVALHYLKASTASHLTNLYNTAKATANLNSEIVFCLPANPASRVDNANYSLIKWTSGSSPNNSAKGTAGYCTATSRNNSRKVAATQISVYYTSGTTATSLSDGAVTAGSVYVATATSFMPSMGRATTAQINSCLNTKMNNLNYVSTSVGNATTRKTVSQCLTDLGVPNYASTMTFIK